MPKLVYISKDEEQFDLQPSDFLVDIDGTTILVSLNGARVPLDVLFQEDYTPRFSLQEARNQALRRQYHRKV